MFELRDRDGLGRLGRFTTSHGTVETPALLPVINPNQVIIPPKEMRAKFGAQIVITNAYIVHRAMRERALADGVHAILDFDGPVMTDSGAFQQHVYGGVEVSNEEIVAFQRDIRADVGTSLDRFSEPDHGPGRAWADIEETLARTRTAAELKGDMLLAGTVQGSLFVDLRRRCAEELSKIDVAVHAIGGVVPLMEAYRFRDLVRVIVAAKQGLRPDRPVHLFGAGHPIVFGLAALLGCDLFDSASYHKYARDGRLLFPDGTRHVEDLRQVPCECPTCSAASLGDLQKDERVRAEHNLYVSFAELRRVRQAIAEGQLWELVERRCRSHPHLLEALRELRHHNAYLERFEPLSRRGGFYFTGPETQHRPILHRYRERLQERYSTPKRYVLLLPEGPRPYASTQRDLLAAVLAKRDVHVLVKSVWGPVPIEFDEMYPIGQSLVPDVLDAESLEALEVFAQRFLRGAGYERGVLWRGEASLEDLPETGPGDFDVVHARLHAVADFQFGRGAANALFSGKVETVRSKRTGKVRTVIREGEHVLSVRAEDGMYTLKAAGAKLLHAAFSPPTLRVVVETETAEFNRQGRNAMAKFVVDADPELRPFDEVLVVDQSDALVAVGRALLNREEMLAFRRGVAVQVREGLP
ncbi:MAG: tRNA guanosine(15) transglycosylase TgtA [Euryarchaeota archaeon]|nr:tRNA guanosine(15) transglycosylase TgtA [Euryarchaeota archaeon]